MLEDVVSRQGYIEAAQLPVRLYCVMAWTLVSDYTNFPCHIVIGPISRMKRHRGPAKSP